MSEVHRDCTFCILVIPQSWYVLYPAKPTFSNPVGKFAIPSTGDKAVDPATTTSIVGL